MTNKKHEKYDQIHANNKAKWGSRLLLEEEDQEEHLENSKNLPLPLFRRRFTMHANQDPIYLVTQSL
jgi:hypothetical protein